MISDKNVKNLTWILRIFTVAGGRAAVRPDGGLCLQQWPQSRLGFFQRLQ
jgi:hypothetical protein